jgi:glycosyltransferase involved in cell wall biosynthesis
MTERAKPSLVSVILPVRNGAPWISEQLASIAAQHVDVPWEIVVSDNGSTDNTHEIVTECSLAFDVIADRFVYVDASSKPGQTQAKREGVFASQGDLLVFVDCDDVCTAGWLQALVNASVFDDCVSGRVALDALNDETVINACPHMRTIAERQDLTKLNGVIPLPLGANHAIWRKVWDEIDEPDDDLPAFAPAGDDDVLACRLFLAGKTVGLAADAVVQWRLRSSGREIRSQLRQYGRVYPLLAKRYGSIGIHGENLWRGVAVDLLLAARAAKARLAGDELHPARGEWARALGCLEASLRFRIICL